MSEPEPPLKPSRLSGMVEWKAEATATTFVQPKHNRFSRRWRKIVFGYRAAPFLEPQDQSVWQRALCRRRECAKWRWVLIALVYEVPVAIAAEEILVTQNRPTVGVALVVLFALVIAPAAAWLTTYSIELAKAPIAQRDEARSLARTETERASAIEVRAEKVHEQLRLCSASHTQLESERDEIQSKLADAEARLGVLDSNASKKKWLEVERHYAEELAAEVRGLSSEAWYQDRENIRLRDLLIHWENDVGNKLRRDFSAETERRFTHLDTGAIDAFSESDPPEIFAEYIDRRCERLDEIAGEL